MKNLHQNAGDGIKDTLFFKIFQGSMPRTPLEVLAASVRRANLCPPPQNV